MTNKNDEVTDEKFRQTINKVLETKTPAEVGDALSVSIPTVKRWSEGRNTPHQAMRRPIMTWAEEITQQGKEARQR